MAIVNAALCSKMALLCHYGAERLNSQLIHGVTSGEVELDEILKPCRVERLLMYYLPPQIGNFYH